MPYEVGHVKVSPTTKVPLRDDYYCVGVAVR